MHMRNSFNAAFPLKCLEPEFSPVACSGGGGGGGGGSGGGGSGGGGMSLSASLSASLSKSALASHLAVSVHWKLDSRNR